MIGKKITDKNFTQHISGTQQLQLSTKEYNLTKGAYLISLNINGERKSSKIVVVN